MNVRVRIDTLVLDNLELPRRERDALVPALERELEAIVRGNRPAAAHQVGLQRSGSRVDHIATHVAAAITRSAPVIRGAHIQRGVR